MSKLGTLVYWTIVLAAIACFVMLVVDSFKSGQGTPEKRETNMEHYVEENLE